MIKKYIVKNLDCANCAQKIEEQLNLREDIQECTLSFANSLLIVESQAEIEKDELEKFIQTIESEVTIIEKGKHAVHHCSHHHEHKEYECGHEHHHEHGECSCQHHDHQADHRALNSEGVVSYSIKGLDCANCAMKVEQAISKMDSIEEAVLNFSTETLQVKVKGKIDDDVLLNALQNTIDNVEDGVVLSFKDSHRVIEKPKLFVVKEHISLIIGIVVYIVSIFFQENNYVVIGFLISYLLIGYEVLWKAIKNIFRGEIFDENFLMAVATVGAFAIGDYPEAVAVLLFYSIGEIFQAYAVNKTRSSISSLMDIKSEFANIKTEQGIQKVSPEEVQVNDVIVVKVGEKVPLDGTVINGQSTLDTSSLTGESLPREIHKDEEILAGVVNLTDILEIRVTKPYDDSTVSKILDLMETAASKKAPIEKFITRFAKVYTPTVVGLAVLLAIVPMFIFKDAVFTDWLYRALTFLVVSCPCALVISIPLGLYAGLGKASKLGALIKGGNYLELLKDVDTVVFDKTGTLTQGTFEVVEVNGHEDLLMYGAYGEYYSNHPIGKSIVNSYGKDIDESQIRNFKEIAGKGIEVDIQGHHVLLGNASYFKDHQIACKEPQTVGTIVYIAIDDQYAGSIVVADQIKESTIKGIQALKQSGVHQTVMLTGDHHRVAQDVADRLGIDTVYSELLPQDKVQKVEQLLSQKEGYVAFVGDGINDAPVLARADVGIAMGGVGSDAAIEAADVVLMQDNIETIKDAIQISHKTNYILKQNVAFTLIIKIGVLFLTMFGLSNMWMGVFADVGVTLIAILNSMRILK
jgi:Cd2+/Zn2+-exporting ATPase